MGCPPLPLTCTRLLVWMNDGAAVWCIAFWVWTCRSVWRVRSCGLVVLLICIPPGADELVCAFFGSCATPEFAQPLRSVFPPILFLLLSVYQLVPGHLTTLASTRAEMVGNIRFLTLVKPVLHVLPEVAQPDRKIPFKVRLPA